MKKKLFTLLLVAIGLAACDWIPQPSIKLSVSKSVIYCQLPSDGSGSAIASATLRVTCSHPWTLNETEEVTASVYSGTGAVDVVISFDTENFGTPEYGAFIETLVFSSSQGDVCEVPLYYFHPLTKDDFNGPLFADFCFDNFDKDEDELLSLEEVMAVTTINVNNLGLTLMEGIGYFKNLNQLRCTHNGLEVLDLTGLINLLDLYCSNNYLTELDLTGLNSLKTVFCNNNNLRELVLTGLINLHTLNCYINNLEYLDLKGLNNLYQLECSRNGLTELNLTGLSKLTTLYCGENDLTNLNLTGLSNLQILSCFDNCLEELDLTGLNNLITLTCYENYLEELDLTGLSSLKTLNCKNNLLEELDLTWLGRLEGLSCHNNYLKKLDLTGLDRLTTVYCANNDLKELDVSATPNLTTLQCGNNNTALTVWVNSSTVLGEGSGQLAVWPYTSSTPITVKGEAGTIRYVTVENKI
jgi:Leucine-rich repeat (LRR) protein